MRGGIEYGLRMNRRLHHLPFRALQFCTSHRSAFEGIRSDAIGPYKTSQQCPLCGHAVRANRRKKRLERLC